MAGHGHTSKYKPGEVAWGAEHHIIPVSVYFKTIFWLFVGMVATIAFAQISFGDIHLGSRVIPGTLINNLIAMTIAVFKASLVVMFFMHVRFSTSLVRFWALLGFIWVTLMTFILMDYATRPLDPTIGRPWNSDPGSALPKWRGSRQSEDMDPKLNVNVRPRQ